MCYFFSSIRVKDDIDDVTYHDARGGVHLSGFSLHVWAGGHGPVVVAAAAAAAAVVVVVVVAAGAAVVGCRS